MENTRGGAFWFNFSWQKYSTTNGCFWDYQGKLSGWFSVPEMQSLENVRIVVLKKNRWWCTLILANKALHDYSFPEIFSNISEGLFLKNISWQLLLKFFAFYGSSHRKNFCCSEKFEKILKKTSVVVYNFLILPNKNTPPRMVFGKFVNCFKTAILKNKSERLLLRFSAKAALSYIKMQAAVPTQLINRKGLSQSGFIENVTKFSRALN